MDLSKFVSEEVKQKDDECEAINTGVKKVRRPPMKKLGSKYLGSDTNLGQN